MVGHLPAEKLGRGQRRRVQPHGVGQHLDPADAVARLEHRKRGVDHRVGVRRLVRIRRQALRQVEQRLREAQGRLRGALPYPLLVQGSGSRSELLARFRALGNAVLLGSQSFWEGVDVRGEALSVVVIDKLPFAPPDDPVLAARIEAIRTRGGNPFTELQLPQAVLSLKQGAGRLIRDETDRGVLMLCDPRLASKAYGRQILRSLPPMKLTRDLAEVKAFLSAHPSASHPPGESG